jgi:hypothetical protein
LRSKSDKNDFLKEIFLLKLIFSALEEYFFSALSRPVQQAIPTFGSYRAQTPTISGRVLETIKYGYPNRYPYYSLAH